MTRTSDTAAQYDSASPVEAPTRGTYRPSGLVSHARLAATTVPLTAVLAALSTGLAWRSVRGWYFVVLVPLLAGIGFAPFVLVAANGRMAGMDEDCLTMFDSL
jgi:hypothetical protein